MSEAEEIAELLRLEQDKQRTHRWKYWGPYLAERAWGTVREDYSPGGDAWGHFPHDHARSRAYRWNEDGLAGVCDRQQIWCLALALWNEQDPILKERLFGLTGPEGNHGEDVKEVYFYEDATPTSSYLRYVYKYPQRAYPYRELGELNRTRGLTDREVELADVGMFVEDRYFEVTVEYAKHGPDDLVMAITVHNHGPDEAPIHVLPQLWLRNTWSWNEELPPGHVRAIGSPEGTTAVELVHPELDHQLAFYVDGEAEALFTHNETNHERLHGTTNRTPWVKDAFHHRVVAGDASKVCPDLEGTKSALWRRFVVPAGRAVRVLARLTALPSPDPFGDADELLALRKREADEFYAHIQGPDLTPDRRLIQRQAAAGLCWTMQFYHYDVDRWLEGDALPPPAARKGGRNRDWRHVAVADILSMPDKWEYPWFAAWDLAFHTVAMASVDIDAAKAQLKMMVKEWYQHPNGQTPAYEWEFSDLNPPVLAWATYQVFKIERKQRGAGDRVFLERVFHKLLINFAWWVNRKDEEGNNVFSGGFLGLDNISVFDRSEPPPPGTRLEQADATAWMAMYCLDLMRIALELAEDNSAYEDLASKFFEHFAYIAYALNHSERTYDAPWNDHEGFYFDILRHGEHAHHIPVRSLVGLVPLFAVHVITKRQYDALPNFRRRKLWFLARNPHLAEAVTERPDGRWVLSAVSPGRLERVLTQLLDEHRFLSPFGPRTLSKEHELHPVHVHLEDGRHMTIGYEPGESLSRMKGGNSNWRGPIWFPAGYLIYRSLLRLDHGFGDVVMVPSVAGQSARTLRDAAALIAERMISIFERGPDGTRPVYGQSHLFQYHPSFKDRILFYEYFHGDTGEGLGASHQTGWTALVGDMILREARRARGES
jgi:hypothetical protein